MVKLDFADGFTCDMKHDLGLNNNTMETSWERADAAKSK